MLGSQAREMSGVEQIIYSPIVGKTSPQPSILGTIYYWMKDLESIISINRMIHREEIPDVHRSLESRKEVVSRESKSST